MYVTKMSSINKSLVPIYLPARYTYTTNTTNNNDGDFVLHVAIYTRLMRRIIVHRILR